MPVVIPNNHAIVTQYWTLSGRANPYAVVYGVENDGGDDADILAADQRGIWLTTMSPANQLRVGYSLAGCRVLLRTTGGVLLTGEVDTVTAGTASVANAPPPNVAILVTKRTGLAGPTHRGRFYLPAGLANEGEIDQAGIISDATLQTRANSLLAAFTSSVTPLVILHSTAEAPTPVTSLLVRSLLATQRRRMRS